MQAEQAYCPVLCNSYITSLSIINGGASKAGGVVRGLRLRLS